MKNKVGNSGEKRDKEKNLERDRRTKEMERGKLKFVLCKVKNGILT